MDVSRLDEPIDKSATYLDHYGLEEPAAYRKSRRVNWLRWLPALFGVGVVALGVVVQTLRGRPLWTR